MKGYGIWYNGACPQDPEEDGEDVCEASFTCFKSGNKLVLDVFASELAARRFMKRNRLSPTYYSIAPFPAFADVLLRLKARK